MEGLMEMNNDSFKINEIFVGRMYRRSERERRVPRQQNIGIVRSPLAL